MDLNHNPSLAEVFDKLETLGSPDQIALFLEDQGIKATKGNGMSCAIAKYAKQATGTEYAVNVGIGMASLMDNRVETVEVGHDGTQVVRLFSELIESVEGYYDGPVGQFITRFDNGEYPSLVSHPEI